MLDAIEQHMFVAHDLEQVRGESLSLELVRSLVMAFAQPFAQVVVFLCRLCVHPRIKLAHPHIVDLFRVELRKDRVGGQARRAAEVLRTLHLDDPQELLQLLGGVWSDCSLFRGVLCSTALFRGVLCSTASG